MTWDNVFFAGDYVEVTGGKLSWSSQCILKVSRWVHLADLLLFITTEVLTVICVNLTAAIAKDGDQ